MKLNKKLLPVIIIIFVVLVSVALLLVLRQRKQVTPPQERAFGDEPGMTYIENEMVAGFPEFPIYPDANVIYSYEKEGGEKMGYEVLLTAHELPSTVFSWYNSELQSAGWTISEESNNLIDGLGTASLHVEKDGVKAGVFLSSDDDDDPTEISIEFPVTN